MTALPLMLGAVVWEASHEKMPQIIAGDLLMQVVDIEGALSAPPAVYARGRDWPKTGLSWKSPLCKTLHDLVNIVVAVHDPEAWYLQLQYRSDYDFY